MKSFERAEPKRNRNQHRAFPKELSRKFRPERLVASDHSFARYQAYDLVKNRSISLSVVCGVDVVFIARIAKTVDALSRIEHPNIVPILEHGVIGKQDSYYWVTPRTDVVNWHDEIEDYLRKSGLSNEIGRLIADLLRALDAAHQQKIVHGSISPAMIVRYKGRYCLTDFAIPKMPEPAKEGESASRSQSQDATAGMVPSVSADIQGIGKSIKEIIDAGSESDSNSEHILPSQIKGFISRLIESDPARQFKSVLEAQNDFTALAGPKTDESKEKGARTITTDLTVSEPPILKPEVIAATMPLLARAIMGMEKSVFQDVIVLHINHCAEDLFNLNLALRSLGAAVVFVAAPYGNSYIPWPLPYVVYHSKHSREGFGLYRNSQQLEHKPLNFEDAVRQSIMLALENEVKPLLGFGKKHLLLIEDGGYHYGVIDDIRARDPVLVKSLIGVVEQTASGAKRCSRYARTKGLPYPVITVARSDIKMRYETYFIAHRIVDELNHLLYQANDFLSFHNVVIIGYGIIGRSIARTLKSMNCPISVIDIDPNISNLAKEEGHNIFDAIPSSTFDRRCVVIGATGESSFSHSMLANFLQSDSSNLYLASASSKRVEFADLIEFFEGNYETRNHIVELHPALGKVNNIQIESNQTGLTYHFTYQGKRKSIVMIAEGYPVNFYRPQAVSLTPAIMDPIVTEIALCSEHLARFSQKLEHVLYLVGGSQIPGFNIDEERLISEWLKLNELSEAGSGIQVWDHFPTHPFESLLRAKCLELEM